MPSDKECCVSGCKGKRTVLHGFPNPVTDKERFNTWVRVVGNDDILALKTDAIYKYRRVCHSHFEQKYLCRSNRISIDAVPTLNMPGEDNIILHVFPNPEKHKERFLLWKNAIGGEILSMDHHTIYECRRVCHSHFELRHHTGSKRLSPAAVPTLYLKGTSTRLPMQDISDHLNRNDNVKQNNDPTTISSLR